MTRFAAGALALAAAGCSGGDDWAPIGTVAASLPTDAKIRWLNVKNGVGSIRVVASRTDEVKASVDVAVRPSLRERFPAADAARDFELKIEKDAVWLRSRHLDGSESGDWKLDVSIEAPPRMHWTLMQSIGAVRAEPAGGDVIVNVTTGTIDVKGSAGGLELVTTAGSVHVELATVVGGSVIASTGEISLRLADAAPRNGMHLETSLGAITIELPRGSSLDVDLLATTGSVDVKGARGLEMKPSTMGRHVSGSVGSGGPLLRASTGVGSISLTVRP